MRDDLIKLLEKAEYELTTTNGLYCTDLKKEADKIPDDRKWQLNNTELINEIDTRIKLEKEFMDKIRNEISLENILETVYNYANTIKEKETELLDLKYNIESLNKTIQEDIDRTLNDKELMQEWKEEYNITNNQGRMLKINEDFKDEKEAIKQSEIKARKLSIELSFIKRIYNLHSIVFEQGE